MAKDESQKKAKPKKPEAPKRKPKKTVEIETKQEPVAEAPKQDEVISMEGQEFVIPKEDLKRPERYFESVGRRKTATARVRLFTRSGDFSVNNKLYSEYFPTIDLQKIAEDSLQKMKLFGRFRISAKVSGGGSHSQAEAVRHGLARALIKFNPDFRKRLKRAGYLMRDPRMKERKKFGLKKARRAPQWAKR